MTDRPTPTLVPGRTGARTAQVYVTDTEAAETIRQALSGVGLPNAEFITGNVATATAGGIPRNVSKGVIRNPPPMPKRPEMNPTAVPSAR